MIVISVHMKSENVIPNDVAFDNFKEYYLIDLLRSQESPLTTEEVMPLDYFSEPASVRKITTKKNKALDFLEQGISVLINNESQEECSAV